MAFTPFNPNKPAMTPYTPASDILIANHQETEKKSSASDLVTGSLKGLGETAVNTSNLISKGLQKVGVPEGTFFTPTQEDVANTKTKLEAKTPLEQGAKTVEQVAEYFVPGTQGLKAEKTAGLFTKMGTEALSTGLVTTAQTGDVSQGGVGAGVGAVSPLIGKTLSFITQSVPKRALAGVAKGTNILDSVLDNPRAAIEGLNMSTEEVFKKDVGLLKGAVTKTYTTAKNAYSSGLQQLDKAIPQVDPSKATPFITTALDKFGVKLEGDVASGFIVNTSEAPLSDAEKTIVQKAVDIISKSTARTPSEVDALAQKVGKLERSSADAMQVNSIIRSIKNGLRQSIIESAPNEVKDIAENITTNYAKSMDKLGLYQQLFRVSKDKLLTEVERANATNKLKNLFSGEKTLEQQALKELGLEDIISRQAGRVSGAEEISRAQVGLGDLLKTAVNTVLTPKTITNIAAHIKLGADAVSNIISKSKTVEDFIGALPKTVQGSALQFLRDLED